MLAMTTMEDGHLIVVTKYKPSEPYVEGDIFGPDGKFKGKTELPPAAVSPYGMYYGGSVKMVFKNKRAYAIVTDGEQETALVRYTYKLVEK